MKMWRIILLAAIVSTSLFSISCAGTHVSVGVHTVGPYSPYGGPYYGPPVWVGRPYPGIW